MQPVTGIAVHKISLIIYNKLIYDFSSVILLSSSLGLFYIEGLPVSDVGFLLCDFTDSSLGVHTFDEYLAF